MKAPKTKTYITLSDQNVRQFREVAEEMTRRGYKMNHSHARGLLHQALRKLAKETARLLIGTKPTAEHINNLVNSEGFHQFVMNEIEEFDMEKSQEVKE